MNQHGSVNGSSSFPILRGVKQGVILSAILFNCVLDIAFERWKARLTNEGLYIVWGLQRLTNTRYADDVLIYAKSLQELESMTEALIQELAAVGLVLNAKKIKILHIAFHDDRSDVDFVEIAGEFIRILHDDQVHRYLGRHLNLDPTKRINKEMTYRRK